MIYTITFNPALDYISQVDNFEVGKINRTKTEEILSGGKGLNVSTVLSNLGIESTALGFIAGFTGEELKKNIENLPYVIVGNMKYAKAKKLIAKLTYPECVIFSEQS